MINYESYNERKVGFKGRKQVFLNKIFKNHLFKVAVAGGKKINKTSSTVVLNYKDHQVRCKKSRNRDGNRFFARRQLCEIVSQELGFPTRDQEKINKGDEAKAAS